MKFVGFKGIALFGLLACASASLSAHAIEICKQSAPSQDGSQVTGTFSFTISGISGPVYVPVGGCSGQISAEGTITITEAPSSGAVMTGFTVSPDTQLAAFSLANGTVTVNLNGLVVVTFMNSVPQQPQPTGGAGCTPGFYKKHLSAYPSQYPPTATLGSIFDLSASAYSSLAGVTIHAAMDFKGGPTIQDAAALLLRQASAALLNAADGHYALSVSTIISDTNAALASLDRSTILSLENYFDQLNNQCDASSDKN